MVKKEHYIKQMIIQADNSYGIERKKRKSMKLSNNFSLKEMTKSQTATRRGIDNDPGEEEQALIYNNYVNQVLQKVRDHL